MKQIHTGLLFALCALFGACAADQELPITPLPDKEVQEEKTPIELSVGIEGVKSPATRAITVEPSGDKYRAFENSTQLYMIYKCDDLSSTPRATKYTKTIGLAGKVDSPAYGSTSPIDFAREQYTDEHGKFMRYWEDAYSRESALSIYAICFPGCNAYAESTGDGIKDIRAITWGGDANYANLGWDTTSRTTLVTWHLTEQNNNGNGLPYIDLCYSNNVANNSNGDNRIKFNTTTKIFETNKTLYFYHLTSKFSFIIKKDTENGFATTDAFDFATNANIKLQGFNNKVTNFDVSTGELATNGSYTTGDINKLWEDNPTKDTSNNILERNVRGLVYPETDMTVDYADAVTFTINNNKYSVSRKQLYDAIKANTANVEGSNVKEEYLTGGKTLKAGVHYIFTFNIGKTKINNITASVVDWESVTANDIDATSQTITVTTKDVTANYDKTQNFDLYRLPYTDNGTGINMNLENYEWTGRYSSDKATLTKAGDWETSHKWNTNWYYESNKTFYHFRAVMPKEKTVNNGASLNPETDDYLSLTTAAVTTTPAATYEDVIWGAPFKEPTGDGGKYSYDFETKGFDGTTSAHQIHHGITTTNSTINLLLFHMMSDVTFNITTTTDDSKVTFKNSPKETTVKLVGYAQNGKVLMGNGKVETTGSAADLTLIQQSHTDATTTDAEKIVYQYGFVPQDLSSAKLLITTADNNQYTVELKDILATVTNTNLVNPYTLSSSKYKIDKWYPGFKYVYNLRIKKTEVSVSASIVDWETVEAFDDVWF